MTYGSPDYWMTMSEYLITVYDAMLAFMVEDGSVITALDSLDGKIDNVITLDQLTGDQLTLLAAMLGVNVSLINTGDVPDAIDMLDNVLDGKLDLNQLSNALISRQLLDSITQLTAMVAAQGTATTALGTIITALAAELAELTAMKAIEQGILYKDHFKVDISPDTILDISASTSIIYLFKGSAHRDNTANVTFILKRDAVTKQSFVVPPGSCKFYWETVQDDYWNIIQVVAASGEQHYQFWNPFI